MSEFLAELFGTFILLLLGNGVVAGAVLKKSLAQDSGWLFINIGWGISVALAIFAVGSISGAHINPAVTIGLASIGEFPWAKVPTFIIAQFLGAIIGAVVVWLHYLPHWSETPDPDAKLGTFCTGPAIPSFWSNLLSEIIGTFVLLNGLLFIGANAFTEGLNPIVVGFLIVAIGMGLGGTTGYAINPARDLGPRFAHQFLPIPGKRDSNWSYAIVPGLGPIIGGVFGATLYNALFLSKMGIGFYVSAALVLGVMVMAVMERK